MVMVQLPRGLPLPGPRNSSRQTAVCAVRRPVPRNCARRSSFGELGGPLLAVNPRRAGPKSRSHVDRGGTFTDVVVVEAAASCLSKREVWAGPMRYAAYAAAAILALRALLPSAVSGAAGEEALAAQL